jgi:nucleoside 2-deoxyribosyltransferase
MKKLQRASPKVYLAGPDVFLPDPAAHFELLRAKCRDRGLVGVSPFEGGVTLEGSGDDVAERIYVANIGLLRQCDAVLANLMPFRNATEPDSGTVFEVGFAVALGKPVVGYLPDRHRSYEEKVVGACGMSRDAHGVCWDRSHGFMVEEFGQPMNLMLSRSTALFGDIDSALDCLAEGLRIA